MDQKNIVELASGVYDDLIKDFGSGLGAHGPNRLKFLLHGDLYEISSRKDDRSEIDLIAIKLALRTITDIENTTDDLYPSFRYKPMGHGSDFLVFN